MTSQPVSFSQQIMRRYSLPMIKVTIGLGLVFLARKAEVSENPIFRGSSIVDFILCSAKIFGALGAFQGIGQVTVIKDM